MGNTQRKIDILRLYVCKGSNMPSSLEIESFSNRQVGVYTHKRLRCPPWVGRWFLPSPLYSSSPPPHPSSCAHHKAYFCASFASTNSIYFYKGLFHNAPSNRFLLCQSTITIALILNARDASVSWPDCSIVTNVREHSFRELNLARSQLDR